VDIDILNGSSLADIALAGMARRIEEIFHSTARISRVSFDMNAAYDSSRGQSNSTALLAQILDLPDRAERKCIGVVDVDLFIPVLTFVFGEAQFGGIAAVVSTHRLRNQFYGLATDEALMLQRLEKELVHELGHTFGLYHCRHFECVMRSSTYVEEIDMKQVHPCAGCAASLAPLDFAGRGSRSGG
jgi:archaemetzincin